MRTKQSPEDFFYGHAGWSYHPDRETPEQGRRDCARRLAEAEGWALRSGIRFRWVEDGNADDRTGICHEGELWCCYAMDGDECVASLSGIDLGADGDPSTDPYGRVIEAELAQEAMDQE